MKNSWDVKIYAETVAFFAVSQKTVKTDKKQEAK